MIYVHRISNETYRFCIAHIEKEIDTIIGVFCVNKTGFLRPGHIIIIMS